MSVYIAFKNMPFSTLITGVVALFLGCVKKDVIEKAQNARGNGL
jgi:hypothetical protein